MEATSNGVRYLESLVSMHGMCFTLVKDGTTPEQIKEAKRLIYRDHDVVGPIRVMTLKELQCV